MTDPFEPGLSGAPAVAWRAWAPQTFALAREAGKLVFLDLTASWCHWCHVLDRTSLSDPRVVALLNGEYVPVRVDTDRRPDINERYNQGGWPTTAVLLPDGQLLTGATYLPPDALFALLSRCLDFYRRERPRIEEYFRGAGGGAEREAGPEPAEEAGAGAPPGPRPEDLALVRYAVMAQYDAVHPGLFREPKFLVPEVLAFLRDCWTIGGNREAGEVFLAVLRRMAGSGVFDPADGGFFRYATRRDWTAPHYEKLLVDNAKMLSLYASAFERTGEAVFAAAAEGILRFLFLRLYDPSTGAFFASRDADEAYYALSAGERAFRVPPRADRTFFSEYNAAAVSALAAAHRAFAAGKPVPREAGGSLLDRAARAAAFLREALWSEEKGQIRFRDGDAAEAGHLADNVAAAAAHMDLYEASGDGAFLSWAVRLLDGTVRRFYSAARRGFLDRQPAEEDVGFLSVPLVPFDANAAAAMALLRAGRAAGRTDLVAVGVETIRGLSGVFDRRGAFAAPYGSALLVLSQGPAEGACAPGDPRCEPKG